VLSLVERTVRDEAATRARKPVFKLLEEEREKREIAWLVITVPFASSAAAKA
jgi:hypothetical protein